MNYILVECIEEHFHNLFDIARNVDKVNQYRKSISQFFILNLLPADAVVQGFGVVFVEEMQVGEVVRRMIVLVVVLVAFSFL